MTGMGYQEMIFNYLGSKKDYIERMCIDEASVIEISNPMSENYQFVRNSILPSLLNAEKGSANAVYPHKIFETGKIAFFDDSDSTGTSTAQSLGFLTAEQNANFNTAASEAANRGSASSGLGKLGYKHSLLCRRIKYRKNFEEAKLKTFYEK